jgi:hypothetical protein
MAGSRSASSIAELSASSRHSVYRIAAAGSLSMDPKLPCPEICALQGRLADQEREDGGLETAEAPPCSFHKEREVCGAQPAEVVARSAGLFKLPMTRAAAYDIKLWWLHGVRGPAGAPEAPAWRSPAPGARARCTPRCRRAGGTCPAPPPPPARTCRRPHDVNGRCGVVTVCQHQRLHRFDTAARLPSRMGALAVRLAGRHAQLVHGEEDAPVHGLQAVAHIWQRPPHDDRHGVLQGA